MAPVRKKRQVALNLSVDVEALGYDSAVGYCRCPLKVDNACHTYLLFLVQLVCPWSIPGALLMEYCLGSTLKAKSCLAPSRYERWKAQGTLLKVPAYRPSQRALKSRNCNGVQTCALSSSGSSSSSSSPEYINLGGGDAILVPKSRKALGPSFDLDASGALNVQLAVRPNARAVTRVKSRQFMESDTSTPCRS